MARRALRDISPGDTCRIVEVRGGGAGVARYAEMGITPGVLVEVARIAPLGDPVEIRVRGYRLSLRREEADGIDVETL
ncbi:MAG: ferrous iron transport protein A [Spirochaetota bacterium]